MTFVEDVPTISLKTHEEIVHKLEKQLEEVTKERDKLLQLLEDANPKADETTNIQLDP